MKQRVIYCRVSTKTKRKKADSQGNISEVEQNPSLQIAPIHQMFPESVDAEIYIEKASAYKNGGNDEKRPIFAVILQRIEAGEISDLYLFDLDRAYRSRSRSMSLFEMCIKKECKIHSVNQNWLESILKIEPISIAQMISGIVTNVITWVSEEDSRNKSAKIRTAVVKKPGEVTRSHNGTRWGHPCTIPEQDIAKMRTLRQQGLSYEAIGQAVGRPGKTVWEKLRQ